MCAYAFGAGSEACDIDVARAAVIAEVACVLLGIVGVTAADSVGSSGLLSVYVTCLLLHDRRGFRLAFGAFVVGGWLPSCSCSGSVARAAHIAALVPIVLMV